MGRPGASLVAGASSILSVTTVRLRGVALGGATALLWFLAPAIAQAAATVHVGANGPFSITVATGTTVDVELAGGRPLYHELSGARIVPWTAPVTSNDTVLHLIRSSAGFDGASALFTAERSGRAAITWSNGIGGLVCDAPPASPPVPPSCSGIASVPTTPVAVTVVAGSSVPSVGTDVRTPAMLGAALAMMGALCAACGGRLIRRRGVEARG
jgi:hypothetical protein